MPRIELKVTHTHAGTAYPAGHVIDVDDHTARWLIERSIGVPVVSTPNPVLDGDADASPSASGKRHRSKSAKE